MAINTYYQSCPLCEADVDCDGVRVVPSFDYGALAAETILACVPERVRAYYQRVYDAAAENGWHGISPVSLVWGRAFFRHALRRGVPKFRVVCTENGDSVELVACIEYADSYL